MFKFTNKTKFGYFLNFISLETIYYQGETPEPPLKKGANTSEGSGGSVSPLFQGGLRGFLDFVLKFCLFL
jgi:hypothetical protein